MRKINLIFAAVFAAAIIAGGVNMFTAVDVGVGADRKGAGVIDKRNAVDAVGASCVRLFVDKEKAPDVERNRNGPVGEEGIDSADKKGINTVRKGRRIQVDGFLLEWREADANVWPGSRWLWDAVGTPDGVAGYVSLPVDINSSDNPGIGVDSSVDGDDSVGAPTRPAWVFTFRAENTGRLLGALEIKLPGPPAGENFAFDKGAFDAGGTLTAEWIVPWDLFDDGAAGPGDAYRLSINAVGAGAGALPTLVLSVAAPEEPRTPGGIFTRLAMAVAAAALTIALIAVRRRQMREKRLS